MVLTAVTRPSPSSLDARAGHDTDAVLLQVTVDVVGHLRVEHVGHDLGGKVDYGHQYALRVQVFRCLKADEAAADYDSTFHVAAFM